MSTYNRPHQLNSTLGSIHTQAFKDFEVVVVDDGNDKDTAGVCGYYAQLFPLKYLRLNRAKYTGYNNPAYPNNVAIRQTSGELIVLQNAECRYANYSVLGQFVAATGPNDAIMGQVQVLENNGNATSWYSHALYNPRPFFFCGCMRREWFYKLRGFDEDYQHYGMEDVDFADRLVKAGVKFTYSDIPIEHQWHGESHNANDSNNLLPILMYERKKREMTAGVIGVERNLNKDWGYYHE